MKKLFALLLALLLCLSLAACGNMSLGLGNFEFDKVHITTYDYSGCVEVDKWYNNETGIEIKTPDGSLYLSEGSYILVEDNCPVCDKVEE